MQPFDALTMRAVLQEARPLLVNRRIEKIYQLGRDEVILAMRLKTGNGHLLLSAQASFGRLCLINVPQLPKHVNPPAFCQLLRKHLSGATLLEISQIPGERVADLTFGCLDELGSRSTKVLTAEIMGRHSNLIFWDKETQKIIGASHVVTQEMSRQREVAPGLPYVRPPKQDKPSIFEIGQQEFTTLFEKLQNGETPKISGVIPSQAGHGAEAVKTPMPITTIEQWLISSFSGIGRHLAEELVATAGVANELAMAIAQGSQSQQQLWQRISQMQSMDRYRAAMKLDLTRYTVLSWWPALQGSAENEEWKRFPTVNDMIEDYFRTLQLREQMQQLKDRIRSELRSESEKIESRLNAAEKQLETTRELDHWKKFGDLILANVHEIKAGQVELVCQDLYESGPNSESKITIVLNPNLSAAQNAQHYYRQFAKGRTRQKAASVARSDAAARLEIVKQHIHELDEAKGQDELNRLKELILDRGRKGDQHRPQNSGARSGQRPPQQQAQQQGAKTPRLMSTKSSDGWLIYIGRNKNENDVLISKLAHPHDIWLHVQGSEGAHVLIKNPNKQDPPLSTLKEAAQLAARFSRISFGSKVRVVYTYCKYVKKVSKDKPGLVRYENEKTIEVDTAAPMPDSLRKLFAK